MERTVKSQTDITAPQTSRTSQTQPLFLILGAGYTVKALIPSLIKLNFRVVATTRSDAKFKAITDMGVDACLYETENLKPLLDLLMSATHILSSVPPTDAGDPFINSAKKLYPNASMSKLAPNVKWAGYLSATSVYGNRDGQWAYENEFLYPVTSRGKNRAIAEMDWLESDLPVHIFRLAGIYGPGRNPFNKLKSGTARAVIKDGHIVNRIHVDDITRALLTSLKHPNPISLYNLADDLPAPPQDVLDFAADLIGTDLAKRVSIDAPEVSEMARSFYQETKRVSNQYAKDALGWQPEYPNYKTGLMSVLKTEMNASESEFGPETIIVSGHIDVPKADLKSVKLALPTHIRLSHQEKDCVFFHIRQNISTSTRFHVSEIFKNKAGYKRHLHRMKNSEWALITKSSTRHYEYLGL